MPRRPWKDIKMKGEDTPERRDRNGARKLAANDAMTLAEIRETRGQTQAKLAAAMAVSQGRISRLERSGDIYLSTLRDYVQAMGGTLELSVIFEDEEERVKIEA